MRVINATEKVYSCEECVFGGCAEERSHSWDPGHDVFYCKHPMLDYFQGRVGDDHAEDYGCYPDTCILALLGHVSKEGIPLLRMRIRSCIDCPYCMTTTKPVELTEAQKEWCDPYDETILVRCDHHEAEHQLDETGVNQNMVHPSRESVPHNCPWRTPE